MYCRTRSENFFQYGMAVVVLLLCMQFQPSVSARFILHPKDTTVTIGSDAKFYCRVSGNMGELDWIVQMTGTSLATTGNDDINELQELGIFWNITKSENISASITIPAIESTNCSTVMCRDTRETGEGRFSQRGKLIVLGAPSPPEPVAVLINSTFQISWNEPFTWPNHSISNYTISAEISTSEMEVLTPTILPHTTNSYTLDGSSYDVCTEVLFKVTATSDLGESRASNVTAGIPIVPGSIHHDPNISVDLTFTQDLTPMVEITFELPSICPFQEEKYEINIYEIREAGKELVYTLNHTYRGNSATFVATSSVLNLSKDKVYFFSVATPRGVFSANKTFNTTLIISSPTTITTQSITSGEGDAGPPYLYIGIGVGVFVVLLLLLLLLCCSIVVCKLCCSKSDQKTKKKKDVDSSTWDSFLTNQNDILRQARAENPRTASTYESIDEYQEKAMLSTQMQSLAQKSSSLDRYQKHPMQQLPPPAVPDRRHSREESPYTTMGSAPSTLQNQQKLDLKNQGSPQHPSIYPSLDTEVVPNNDETRVSGGSAGYFSSASGGDDVNAYDHITPMDPLAEQSKQDIPGESFMGSQDEGHFVQTEC